MMLILVQVKITVKVSKCCTHLCYIQHLEEVNDQEQLHDGKSFDESLYLLNPNAETS